MSNQATHRRITVRRSWLLLAAASLLFAVPTVQADVSTVLKGGPTFSTEDGSSTFRLRGRIHFDSALYLEDDESMQNGFRFRRTRLGIQGKGDHDWIYMVEYDFAENGVDAKDVYIGYTRLPVNGKVGQFKVPFSLEELTSSNSITFMERSLANVFAPARRISLGIDTSGDRYSVAASTFGRGIGDAVEGDQPMGAGLRATVNPLEPTADRTIHLGAAATWERTDNENTWRWRQRPESRVDGARLVDTGSVDNSRAIARVGGELAWIEGPFALQGEYIFTELDRGDEDNLTFDGYYAQAGFVLGGSHGYRNGVRRGVSIDKNSDFGAVEFAVRYSHVNLNADPVLGGDMSALTMGSNWHAHSNIRFMLNYGMILTDDEGPRTDDPMVVQARIQVAF